MHDLRLIGVQDDGEFVLLTDAEGERYRLPLDEALRAASRRDRPRLGQLQIEVGGLRPREVQDLIRSGLSTEEVAERSGWTTDKVRRFEAPVLAEREYVANLAQATRVGRDSSSQTTLSDRSSERLTGRGVEQDKTSWDSWRSDRGVWTVTLTFPAGGRERTAQWRFDPKASLLRALNDDARWLSEDDAAAGVIPTPHVATSANPASAVYDVEAEGGVQDRPTSLTATPSRGATAEEEGLVASVRANSARDRRGRRKASSPSPAHTPGEQQVRVDALPLEDLAGDLETIGEPPARPRRKSRRASAPVAAPSAVDTAATEDAGAAEDTSPVGESPSPEETQAADPAPSLEETQVTDPAPTPKETQVTDPATAESTSGKSPAEEDVAPATPSGKKGRSRVPSWDDIVFGTKPRGDR